MKDEYRAVGSWSTLGLEIVLSVMLGFFGGHWLDGRLGTAPWLSLLGFFFGCGAAGRAVHRAWKEMQVVTAREERERGNPTQLYEKPEDHDRREKDSRDEPSAPMSSPEEHRDEHAP